MNNAVRLVLGLLVRLVLLFFAGWFAIAESALPGASVVSRVGLSLMFLMLSILVGEVSALRLHVGMVLGALRKVSGGGSGAAATAVDATADASAPGDVRDSVDILIRALGAADDQTRQKAHAHLQRLTGQDLPADADAWGRWWADSRDTFQAPTT